MTYCPTSSDQLGDFRCYCPLFVDVESDRKLILLPDDLQPSTSLRQQRRAMRPIVVVVAAAADGDDDDCRSHLPNCQPIERRRDYFEFAPDFDNHARRNHQA